MSERRPGLEIVNAVADDAVAVHGLVEELAHTTGLAGKFSGTVDAYLKYGFGPSPLFESLVAKLDGVVIGVALYFYTFSSWRGEPGVYLQDLVVTESARGLSIGEQLMRQLASTAKERGVTHLRLAVDRDNLGAGRFYDRCGLSKTEADHIYEIDGERFARMSGDE